MGLVLAGRDGIRYYSALREIAFPSARSLKVALLRLKLPVKPLLGEAYEL